MQAYTQFDQRIHLLAQILAKINRTYVPKKANDSHTNLSYDPIRGLIFGRWIDTPKGRHIFCIDLAMASLSGLDSNHKVVFRIPILGKTFTELEEEIEQRLVELGVSPEGFTDKLHFEIANYDFTHKAFEKFDTEGLMEWAKYRQLANIACGEALTFLQTEGEIRIWPHHFDTGIYVEPNSKLGFGFGLAMEDGMVGAPYFYLAVYGLGEYEVSYEDLPKLPSGKWVCTDHWKGGVLSLEELVSETKFDDLHQIQGFIRSGISIFLDRLWLP